MTTHWRASFAMHGRDIILAWLWFFLILFSYYALKPVRDSLGTTFAKSMGSLYTATFVTTMVVLPMYSWVVSRVPRRTLTLIVYQFFVICLLGFLLGIRDFDHSPTWLAAVFFVWVSVFNLVVVTLFWSVMADVFSDEDARLWFGTMAAAGSLGSVCGSALALLLSKYLGPTTLLLASMVTLECALVVSWQLGRRSSPGPQSTAREEQGTGGSVLAGVTRVLASPYLLGICGFVALGKFAATFIYNNLQIILEQEVQHATARTVLFSQMNLSVQSGSLILQALVAGLLLRRLDLAWTLAIPCLVVLALFVTLSQSVSLALLVTAQMTMQILGYGLLVPAQHVLFTVVSREDKYKSKAFVDIVVFRGSDVAAANLCEWVLRSGMALTHMATAMLPVLGVWLMLAIGLGIGHNRRRALEEGCGTADAPASA